MCHPAPRWRFGNINCISCAPTGWVLPLTSMSTCRAIVRVPDCFNTRLCFNVTKHSERNWDAITYRKSVSIPAPSLIGLHLLLKHCLSATRVSNTYLRNYCKSGPMSRDFVAVVLVQARLVHLSSIGPSWCCLLHILLFSVFSRSALQGEFRGKRI